MRYRPFRRASTSVTRRDFVKTSAGVIVGSLAAGLPACAVPAAGVHVQGSDKLRIALVGCGGRGTGAASDALHADAGTELVAMGDVFADRIASSLEHLSKDAEVGARVRVDPDRRFTGFDACDKVLASGVDVVILATPPHFRPMHLKACVDAGVHVFCEKPVAVDVPGVRSVLATVEAARAKQLAIVSGFCWRYSDAERATFREIHEGRIGDVTAVHTNYLTGSGGVRARKPEWSDMEFQIRNWFFYTWLGGDHIVEQDCHSIDKIAWAMNGEMPVRAYGVGGRQVRVAPEFGNVYDHFAVTYEYASGARAFNFCRQTDACFNDNTDFIVGTKGNCFINGWGPTHVIKGEKPWTYEGPHRNMYQNEHDAMYESIRSGKPINDGVWMTNSTMMAILGRTCAYTGQAITWEQAMASTESFTLPKYELGPVPVAPVPMPGRKAVS